MYLSKFDFYRFDIQAVGIIIVTICVFLAANRFMIKDNEDRLNEILVVLCSGMVGFLFSLLVSYITLEADIKDTSDFYNK